MAQTGRLQSLQVLRFFAALAVACEHASTLAIHRNGRGGFGVDVFFVLSGFVISRAASSKPQGFLADRLTRIYPVYWLWAVAWMVLAPPGPLDLRRIFWTISLIPAAGGPQIGSYVVVSWTLSYELMFYVAVWMVLRGVAARWLLVAWGATFAAGLVEPVYLIRFAGSPMVVEFLLGVLAWRIGRRTRLLGALALAAAVAIWLTTPHGLGVGYAAQDPVLGPLRATIWGPAAFLAVWGAAQFDCSARLWRPLAALGDASYSLYLGHVLVFALLARAVGGFNHWIAATAFAVAVCSAVYWIVERPVTRAARGLVASLLAPGARRGEAMAG